MSILNTSTASLMAPGHHLNDPLSILKTLIGDPCVLWGTATKDLDKEYFHTRGQPSNQNLPTYVFYFCHVDFYRSMAPSWSSQVINGPFRGHFGSIRPSYRGLPRRVPCFEESASHDKMHASYSPHGAAHFRPEGTFTARQPARILDVQPAVNRQPGHRWGDS